MNLHSINVHQGIGYLFLASFQVYEPALFERIKNYYDRMDPQNKPKSLEIITTGHSLGAAEAEIAAYYYKATQMDKFKILLNTDDITVKSYTFAAPAIIQGEDSKKLYENVLGIENVYRTWITNDPVVTKSELVNKWLAGGVHVGTSIPLYNLGIHTYSLTDIMGPHQADNYLSYITSLNLTDFIDKYKDLTEILNDYIKSEDLYVYKANIALLQPMILAYSGQENPPANYKLHQGLAEHILKNTPSTTNLKPYATIGDILAHSPRFAAALSPRFEVEVEGPVKLTKNNMTDRYQIFAEFGDYKFPIVASTNCSITEIKKFLESKGVTLANQQVESFSCGACLAKRIFVSQYSTFPSTYAPTMSNLVQTAHQDTLTRMLNKCVIEVACTPEYLIKTGRGLNKLEQTKSILDNIGLGDAFMNKKIYFSRFQPQDTLDTDLEKNKIRPGIDIQEKWKSSQSTETTKLPENMLISLMETNPENNKDLISLYLTENEVKNDDSIFNKIISATLQNEDIAHNTIIELLNKNALYDLFIEANIKNKNVSELYNNFKTNILALITIYLEKKNKTRLFSLKLNFVQLSTILDDLGRNVIKSSSWKIKDEPQQGLLEEGVQGQRNLTGPQILSLDEDNPKNVPQNLLEEKK